MTTTATDSGFGAVSHFAGIQQAKNQTVESRRPIFGGGGHRQIVDQKHSSSHLSSDDDATGGVGRGWQLPGGNAPQLPMYHPLDPTALRLRGVAAQTVATRIANFMRLNSVACSYQTTAHTAAVDCLALEGMVTFAVMLWRAVDDDSNDPIVVVEFQRRQGCGFACQRLRNRLYNAVASEEEPRLGDDGVSKRARHCDFMRHPQDDDTATTAAGSLGGHLDEDEMHFEAYDDCLEFLQSPYHDQNRLGLESLCILADSEKTWSPELVAKTSKRIVYGEDNSHKQRKGTTFHHYSHGDEVARKTLGELLEPYFCNIEMSRGSSSQYRLDEGNGVLDYEQGAEFGSMHLLALKSLSSALQSVESLPNSERQACQDQNKFWHSVSKALLYNMEHVAKRPTEAALSAQCARLLLKTKTVERESFPCDSLELVERSLEHGRSCHLLLEQESEQLLAFLSGM